VTAPWGSWEALADETEEEKGVEGGDEDPDEDEGKEQEDEESTLPPPPPPPPKPRRSRVLYLDMDLHYGDGVALAFRSPAVFPYPLKGRPRPPQVLTLSVHHAAPIFFPPGAPSTTPADTPHLFSLAYGLEAYAHAPTYARAWASIERIAAAWKPDYVVLQLGVDALPRDPVGMYGGWGVVGPGSVPWVVERVRAWARPTVVLGGGGYVSADAARAWALSTARLVGSPVGPEESVPDHGFWEEYAPGYTLEVPESELLGTRRGIS
jgi:histone deacetylase 1/2/histone deacetylase 8